MIGRSQSFGGTGVLAESLVSAGTNGPAPKGGLKARVPQVTTGVTAGRNDILSDRSE